MDPTPALESIAKLLPNLPQESMEDLLVTFDALVGVADQAYRAGAARLLREAAALCPDQAGKERLLKASVSLGAGEPCALTAGGLSWSQAAAAQTITLEEWNKREAEMPPPNEPVVPDDSEDEDEEDDAFLDVAPPPLPHLLVAHFFSGLVVRVARDFQDAFGRALCESDLLRLLSCNPSDEPGGYTLSFLDRTVQLRKNQQEILENQGNAWFQPVPSVACLEDLWEAIDGRLSECDDDEDLDDTAVQHLDDIRADLADCQDWLSQPGNPGPAPKCTSSRLVAKAFARDPQLTAWISLLFSGVAVCVRD